MEVYYVKFIYSRDRVSAMLAVSESDPITVDLGRPGRTVSNKKLAERAISKTPGATAGAFMRYSWEPASEYDPARVAGLRRRGGHHERWG